MKTFKDTSFYQSPSINIKGKLMEFSSPKVMGILNISPDSFYDGGKYQEDLSQFLKQVEKHVLEGVDILDLGGMSTKPQAEPVSQSIEWNRLKPCLEAIKKEFPTVPLSIDTYHLQTALSSIDAGANLINDISGNIWLEADRDVVVTSEAHRYPYVCMHKQGDHNEMHHAYHYENLILDLIDYFAHKINLLGKLGIHDVLIDVGFGFSKNIHENYLILKHLDKFNVLRKPLLVGLSRKSMVWKLLDSNSENALNGTSALHMVALQNGAHILRVHDVREAKEVIKLYQTIEKTH